jgi:hypothetical protein
VSLFVLSPQIEDRDEFEVGNWAKHKKTLYSTRVTPLWHRYLGNNFVILLFGGLFLIGMH